MPEQYTRNGPIQVGPGGTTVPPAGVVVATPMHQKGWFIGLMIGLAVVAAAAATVGGLCGGGVICPIVKPEITEVTVRIIAPDPRTGL